MFEANKNDSLLHEIVAVCGEAPTLDVFQKTGRKAASGLRLRPLIVVSRNIQIFLEDIKQHIGFRGDKYKQQFLRRQVVVDFFGALFRWIRHFCGWKKRHWWMEYYFSRSKLICLCLFFPLCAVKSDPGSLHRRSDSPGPSVLPERTGIVTYSNWRRCSTGQVISEKEKEKFLNVSFSLVK